MQHIWIALGVTVAAVVVILPIAAVILVSLASLREEAARSLAGEAPGPGERVARRLLGFCRNGLGNDRTGNAEVGFRYARRPLSDSGKYAADSQSQQNRIRTDQRQGAGV